MINLLFLPIKIIWVIIKTIFKIIFYPLWLLFHAIVRQNIKDYISYNSKIKKIVIETVKEELFETKPNVP